MTDADTKELRLKEKQELTSQGEQTRPGPVYSPDVDIYETEKEITLLADMPGVSSNDLSIDLRDDVLTLSGETESLGDSEEESLLVEYGVGKYYRQFTLSEVIDQENISAELKDGVLRLVLPKVKKATPRKIKVNAA
ncbi:MAG: Hsp20/alpha crystallin family protein [Deltaproteobacteria bacterium]